MHIVVFNACLGIGWLMVLVGGVMLNPGWGVTVGGASLIGLALLSARIGGIYTRKGHEAD